MEAIGQHKHTEISERKDINGLSMVSCRDCGACAHAIDVLTAKHDLAMTLCAPDCENCNNLRHSYDRNPAVPLDGTCNTILHVCPNDGNRWWQSNGHFHLWKQVTSPGEWDTLKKAYANSGRSENGFL